MSRERLSSVGLRMGFYKRTQHLWRPVAVSVAQANWCSWLQVPSLEKYKYLRECLHLHLKKQLLKLFLFFCL